MNFTAEQKRAIEVRDCNVLVSAAAGSGKTGVLTERIVSRLRDGENIDELLTLTFTRAAAGEMKKRVRDKIAAEAESAQGEARTFWQRQLTLVGDAPITTIHSFCLRLLRRHYNLLPGLDPKFHITDPRRAAILRSDLLTAYLEECYTDPREENRNRFFDLLRLYGSRLSDDGLKKEILSLMEFGSAQGDPGLWLDEACRRFGDLDFWYDKGMAVGRDAVLLLIEETEADLESMEQLGGPVSCIDTLAEDLEHLRELKDASWEKLGAAMPFGRKKPKGKEDDPNQSEYIKSRRDQRKKYFADQVTALFCRPFPDYAREIAELLPNMETLAEMTKNFYDRYREEKRQKGSLDFSDLELYAMELLTENPSLAREYQETFREVLVDEYQDINPLQEKILSLLAGDGKLFAVGDIKQSIYGFRLADHTLFRDRALSYGKEEENGNGLLIYLNRNFRSRCEVLSAANGVFGALMNEEVSGLPYGEEERLRFGAEYYEEVDTAEVEFAVIDRSKSDPEGDYDALACHGRYIAHRIEELMAEGFRVQDKDGLRPLTYGDITVLMRSANTGGEAIGAELVDRGIPVQTPSTMGFLSGRETKLISAFLSVLDNPLQDIPLAAVMRSPLFSFDEDELLALGLSRKGKKLWEMVLAADDMDREGLPKEKTARFRETILRWRGYAKIYPVGELVDMFLKEYDYAAFWGGLPNGRRRIKNIRLFAEEAFAYQNDDGGGLFDFLRFLDHLADTGGDVPAETDPEDNCVQVMNIHKSKGLEFPVVFLVQTEKKFNKTDLSGSLILDKELGFGPQFKDTKRRLISPTLPRLLIRGGRGKEDLAEEMRVLYVALTRAKEKLIITAADSVTTKASVENRLESYDNDVLCALGPTLPATLLMSDHTYFSWIMHALAKDRREKSGGEKASVRVTVTPALPPSPPVIAEKPRRLLAADDFERLVHTLHRPPLRPLPAKVSVTSLLPRGKWESDGISLPKPRFMGSGEAVSAAEKGTAFHLFMEKLPLDRGMDLSDLESFRTELTQKGVLSADMAETLDLETVRSFLDSSYGKELLRASEIRRELSFVGAFPAEELFEDAPGDRRSVMLQGAIDLIYCRENGEWVLMDYKTNDLRRCTAGDFLAKYGRQMDLYTAALRKIYGIEVTERVFFLTKTKEFIGY